MGAYNNNNTHIWTLKSLGGSFVLPLNISGAASTYLGTHSRKFSYSKYFFFFYENHLKIT